MKNELKRLLALGFISILVFIGCPNDSSGKGPPVCGEDCECQDCDGEDCDCNEEQESEPVPQSTVITGLFDNDSSATVKGEFTGIEWPTIPSAIQGALNANFGAAGDGIKNTFRRVFNQTTGIIIIVEKTDEYERYSTTRGEIGTIRINVAILDNQDILGSALRDAMRVMDGHPELPEMAQAIPQAPKAAQSVAGTTFS
jgi:hypothetical protein